MKQKKNFWLMAALVCGLGLGVTSCSDDDDKKDDDAAASVVTISNELKTYGVQTDMQSAVIDVPVECDGKWTASLPSSADWVQILDWKVQYDGKQTLQLAFDENLSKADRTTTLKLGNSDGEYQTVTVRQNYNYKGEAPTNGSGLAFAGRGLGTSIDYDYALNVKAKKNTDEKFEPTKLHGGNNIFNISRIEALQAQGKMQHSAYVEATIPIAELHASMLDSSLVQSKSVSLSLTLEVSFGAIQFSAHAGYNSKKDESRAHVDYTITRYSPVYNAYLSPAELSAYAAANRKLDSDGENQKYDEIDALIASYKKQNERRHRKNLNEDGLTPDQQEEIDNMYDLIPKNFDHAGIFSTSFKNRYNELYNALVRTTIRNKPQDTTAADQTLNALDNEYGPFFISGGDFGGSLTMHCLIDTMKLEGKASFDGSMAGGMGGMFNVEGEFHYTEEGYNLLRNSNTNLYIYGGDAIHTEENMLGCIWSNNPNDLQKWQQMLKDWLASMFSKSNDPSDPNSQTADVSQAIPISFTITPIWSLFNEPAIQEYAQKYFMNKYASRGIAGYFGIMNGTDKPGADDLLNADSDWWKKNSK